MSCNSGPIVVQLLTGYCRAIFAPLLKSLSESRAITGEMRLGVLVSVRERGWACARDYGCKLGVLVCLCARLSVARRVCARAGKCGSGWACLFLREYRWACLSACASVAAAGWARGRTRSYVRVWLSVFVRVHAYELACVRAFERASVSVSVQACKLASEQVCERLSARA